MERRDSRADDRPIAEERPDETPRRCCSAESEVVRWALERLTVPKRREEREA